LELYLAPMEGITTYVYRNALNKYYGGIDKYFTPFLTASHLKGRELREVHPDNNKGINLVPQILTNDAELFTTIARQLAELGYSEVNLNLGCPSGTVVSKGHGAGFLDRPDELDRFLNTIYSELAASQKISIKTRIGVEFESEWEDILEIYKKYPISELIIHPRLRSDFYSGNVRMNAYRTACEALEDKISICYNGDIIDIESYSEKISEIESYDLQDKQIIDKTGCRAVMIGRGIIRNPELPHILKDNNVKEINTASEMLESTMGDEGNITGKIDKKRLREFLNEIVEGYREEMSGDNQVVMKMKELWTYLGAGLGVDKKNMKALYKATKLAEFKSVQQMILLR
jgi:tRNA-dihydrouridine synthase